MLFVWAVFRIVLTARGDFVRGYATPDLWRANPLTSSVCVRVIQIIGNVGH